MKINFCSATVKRKAHHKAIIYWNSIINFPDFHRWLAICPAVGDPYWVIWFTNEVGDPASLVVGRSKFEMETLFKREFDNGCHPGNLHRPERLRRRRTGNIRGVRGRNFWFRNLFGKFFGKFICEVSQHFVSLLRWLNYAEKVSNLQLETDSQVIWQI